MAIVNCNEDSFYAPSRASRDKAVEMALAAENDGASIIDFGSESTRPGSSYMGTEEELERLIPVITAFRKCSPLPVSVDTRKAAVARSALEAGADIINDISSLEDDPDMAATCAGHGAVLVLMHRKGIPLTMQEDPQYKDVISEIRSFFRSALERAFSAGIPAEKIILDPGFGFGKTTENNLEILRHFARLAKIRGRVYPMISGVSRKNFIGEAVGGSALHDASARLPGTLGANGAAIMGGAAIVRVHDVKEHVDLAKMLFALGQKN